MRKLARLVALGIGAVAVTCASPDRGFAARPGSGIAASPSGLFGTTEVFSRDEHAFTKWTGALARAETEIGRGGPLCGAAAQDGCVPPIRDREKST